MKILVYGLFLVCSFGAVAGPVDYRAEDIVRSESELREYRYLRLANGLQVMLVSDPDSEKAAASLDVHVGSAQNPADREGLAHFLEHMLFLGTEKYPDPAEYHAFISGHGGSHNAFTATENTNYFFDISAAHLEPALDRFAQFFVAPLFNSEYVEREKHAVHSEFRASVREDSRRFMDALAAVVNPGHPFALFSVGNLDTLDGDVRVDLLDFYAHHYSAQNMALTVVGPQTLNELERIVVPRFAEVPGFEPEEVAANPPIFEPEQLPMLLKVQPEREIRRVSLLFPMPSQQPYLQQKPLAYLANLVGHEGEGSILQLLKEKGWAESLGAGEGRATRHDSFFQVNVELTESGLKNVWSVVELVFAGIEQIGVDGIEEWRYREQADLAALSFRFQERSSSTGSAIRISSSLHDYPYREVLRGPVTMEGFDANLIRKHWKQLDRNNVLISIMAPDVETTATSRYYGTPYAQQAVEFPKPSRAVKRLARQLRLPSENPYVPRQVTLVNEQESATAVPQRLESPERARLWWHADGEFKVPKGSIYIHLRQAQLTEPGDIAARAVLLGMISDQLNTDTYQAWLAGLAFQLQPTREGVTLVVDGFSDRQLPFLEALLAGILAPEWSAERFDRVRTEQERLVRNRALSPPYLQAMSRLRTALMPAQLDDPELADALAGLELVDVRRIHEAVWRDGQADILIAGNFTQEHAESLLALVNERLGLSADKPLARQRSVARIDGDKCLYHHLEHTDTAYIRYMQGRSDSLMEAAAFAVLRRMIQPPFFHSLRTEQQLGYVVTVADLSVDRVPGLAFVVQSPSASASEIDTAVAGFMAQFDPYLEQLDEENFNRYRNAVLTSLLEQPKNLGEQIQRFRASLDLEDQEFNRRQHLIEKVRELRLADVRHLWSTIRSGEIGSVLLVASADNEMELPERMDVPERFHLQP